MRNWKRIMQVAATYIGTVVGAGFASGQEILQFFTVHGRIGALAILISTILFIWLGTKIMRISHDHGCYSYQELNVYLFGRKLSWLVNGLTLLILFGTTGVMLSGTGSIFVEQFGLPFQFGVVLTIALCYLTMYRGMSGVMWVNSLVVPMMLFFSLMLGFNLWGQQMAPLPMGSLKEMNWVVSPLLYVGFNLAMAQAVLAPLGKEIKDRSVLHWGGLLGGVGLGIMLLVNHFSLLLHYDLVKHLEIPMAQVISGFGKGTAILFAFVVFGEIFTTIIGNVFGLVRQAQSALRINQSLAALLILLASFIMSQWGFRSMVTFLYPAFGVMGLFFIARVAVYGYKRKG